MSLFYLASSSKVLGFLAPWGPESFDCVCHIRDSGRQIRADLEGHPQRPLSGNATPVLMIDQNLNLCTIY